METQTPDESGASVEYELQVFGETKQILPNTRTEYNNRQNWLKVVRAFRSDHDWKRVYQYRLLVSRHLGKVVLFPADKS